MAGVMVAVPSELPEAVAFFSQLRGFVRDAAWSSEDKGTTAFAKMVQPQAAAAAPPAPIKARRLAVAGRRQQSVQLQRAQLQYVRTAG